MNFIFSILSTIFGKLFGNSNKTNKTTSTYKIENSRPNNALADARAAIIWICAISLAIYWIPQYSLATYFWIKSSLAHGNIVAFPLNSKKLFDMIASLLGLGAAGIIHKLMK